MYKTVIGMLTLPVATAVFAMNVGGFTDAPMTSLNEAELRAFKAFVFKTLDQGTDGATATWKAPQTVFTSQVTPISTFADGKAKCREVDIDSNSRDRHERGKYVFCKSSKGDWQFKLPNSKKQTQAK